MEFDVTKYPEGYDKVKADDLGFLPDDPEVREAFMETMMQFMLQY